MSRMLEHYRTTVIPELMKQFRYQNVMQIPRIEKITLNMGLGEALKNKNVLQTAADELTMITGQKAVITNARKSEAAFKIREGWPIGAKVTLRRRRMYDFLDRLITVALPRVRDFRGLSNRSFDGRGNYSLGLREQIVFPEIDYDKVDALRGMDIAITTSARTDEEAEALLRAFGLPLKN